MIVMAVPAGCTGGVPLQISMQRGWVLQLGCYICVTGYTLISHGGGLPESGVAGGALVAKTGMRIYSAQGYTRFRIEGAWTEEYAAAHKAHPYHYQNGQ